MSKTLLKKLYDGEIYPDENIYLNKLKDREHKYYIFTEDDYFQKTLSTADYNHLEKLENLWQDHMSAYLYANFLYGFRLGMGFASEAFLNEDLQKLNS